jgi:hypothetical protein
MTGSRRYAWLMLWAAILCVFFATRLDEACSRKVTSPVLGSKLENNVPCGEMVAGFHLRQPVNWDLLDATLLEQEASREVCVSVFLANYANRMNEGTVALTLQSGDNRYRKAVEAGTVRDNAHHRICFEGLVLGDIVYKPTWVIIEGIDSRPGRAITAWMTTDTTHGTALLDGGRTSDRSLTFRIGTVQDGRAIRRHAVFLALICGLSGALLFMNRPQTGG